jgi:ketosteroid isomerase-like protein
LQIEMRSAARPARYCSSMSQENVEIVRRGFEAYARGDLATLLAGIDPEMVTYREEPDGATFHGREGFLQAIAEWVEDFDEFAATAEELIDANDRQVVVRVHQTATGAQSGAPIEGDFWFVHTLSGSKVTRLDMLASKRRALAAVGLSD